VEPVITHGYRDQHLPATVSTKWKKNRPKNPTPDLLCNMRMRWPFFENQKLEKSIDIKLGIPSSFLRPKLFG
jgi:hypothetical protein